jgi:hypothetical protein
MENSLKINGQRPGFNKSKRDASPSWEGVVGIVNGNRSKGHDHFFIYFVKENKVNFYDIQNPRGFDFTKDINNYTWTSFQFRPVGSINN